MTRIAVIEKPKCNSVKCGWLCPKVCPINRGGRECIKKGADLKATIDEKLCTGCGICPNRCPFGAIHIINLPEELTQKPIHRYGENGFALYSLPTPLFGKVVGIIGKNGIGKSTALKILAGQLQPNLGDPGSTPDMHRVIEYFKGTEAQRFFERVANKEIKVSYKPQQVDTLAAKAKGTVRELLLKVDEKHELADIAQTLELERILDHDISTISGGEMQRVAIAATVLKKAQLYIFDEPTSYLDIKQRIRVSRFIKGLAEDGSTAVIVVEHDLIVLDFLTDLVHIMYGKEACYGIVSLPKTAKIGINVYLSGNMREENVRFRDKRIEFAAKPPGVKASTEALVSWSNIAKRLGSFHLTAPGGTLYRKASVGVLGENGIGKTSFIKILAGVEKQDSGTISENIKVSYKPQYLETSEEMVIVVLKDAIRKYHAQLIGPLGIEPLFEKKLSELSGGELQRVAICYCLSQDADLYLLDEPSAYLDVEQRLLVSKLLRDEMLLREKTALVVDHDLLFVDYLSEQLMVGDGIPAQEGSIKGPFDMVSGMNMFLKDLDITFRRDPETSRPRINKPGSVMDRKQKDEDKLYYT